MAEAKTIDKDWLIDQWVAKNRTQKDIAKELNVHLGTVETYIKKYGITGMRTSHRHSIKVDYTDPRLYYLVGLMCSDGYFNVEGTVSIRLHDREILDGCAKLLNYTGSLRQYGKNWSLDITNDELYSYLYSMCRLNHNTKAKGLIWPKTTTKEEFCYLLRGFLDGDGNIRKYSSGSLEARFFVNSVNVNLAINRDLLNYFNIEGDITTTVTPQGLVGSTMTIRNPVVLVETYRYNPELSCYRKRLVIENFLDEIVWPLSMIKAENWRIKSHQDNI